MKKVKSIFESTRDFLLRNKFLIVISLILIIAAVVYFEVFGNKNGETNEYVVKSGELKESVTLTGTVKPSEEASLSFEKSGIVSGVNVKVGQFVQAGDTIATLSGGDENAKVMEARASVDSARAQLEDLQTGSREETINIKKIAIEKTVSDISQSYKNGGDSIKNISISGNTFVRDNLGSQFSGSRSEGYKINNTNSCDSVTENKVNRLRGEAETALLEIEKIANEYSLYEGNQQVQSKYLSDVKNIYMTKITEYLNALKDLFSANCIASNSSYDSIRTLITSSRNTWSTLSADISSKINTIENLKIAKTQAEQDLELAQSGEKSQRIKQQESQVSAAVARLALASSEASKNILSAPFSGIITNIDIKKGELVSPGGKTISMISDSNFEIESKVSEVDVAKLNVGATAEITFDAYGESEKFQANISNISPAGIISEGVPTYKTIFSFLTKDEKIRSGMTANIDVVTKIYPNAISIPAKYIISSGEIKKVNLKNGAKIIEKEIIAGAKGVNGEVEIINGLNVGDVVVEVKK